jgi:hypothetical protein
MAGELLTGNYRVRVIRPALHKVYKMFRKCRNQMELRSHALKLRHWPARDVQDENGQLLDLDWSWIEALRGLRIGELRIADKIGGQENLRIIFYEGDRKVREPLPMMWVLDVLLKKRDYFTTNELDIFKARRTLVIERFYKNRDN